MKKILTLFLVISFGSAISQVLEVKKFTLQELINHSIEKSPFALRAATLKENKYWQWRTYKSNYMPQLGLDGVIPDFSRAINPVIQPDGTTVYQPVVNSSSSLNLSVSQAFAPTGGSIFVSSQLQRFDDFQRDQTRYNGSPALIGFRQPLFAYNDLKWATRIEPLLYEESQKKYAEDIERVALITSEYFFDLLQEQNNLNTARINLASNDTIYKISEVKYNLGKITKGELLQIRLAVLTSEKAVAQSRLAYETAILNLNYYAGLPSDAKIELTPPAEIPQFLVDEEKALAEAKRNRQDAVSFKRQLLEAERDVARAKGDNGLNANLFATFGLTNRALNVTEIYQNMTDQQTVRIGFSIPIIDWGRSASRIKTAQANRKLIQYTIEQMEQVFTQSIHTQVKQFEMLREQVEITKEAQAIAEERYNISKNRYLIGEFTITELNISQQEKDQAKRDYILSLKNFWNAYYNLRVLTLYDFEKDQPIIQLNNL
jgi:outer membrane protein